MTRKPLIAKEPECSSTPIPRAKDGLEPPVAEANIHLKRERVVANGHYADEDPIIRATPRKKPWFNFDRAFAIFTIVTSKPVAWALNGIFFTLVTTLWAYWPAKQVDLNTLTRRVAGIERSVGDLSNKQDQLGSEFRDLAVLFTTKIDELKPQQISVPRRRVVAKKPKKLSIFQ